MSGEDDISAVMGFSGFGETKNNDYVYVAVHLQIGSILLYLVNDEGKKKKAMTFNIEEMFEKSRRTAKEYSAQVKGIYINH